MTKVLVDCNLAVQWSRGRFTRICSGQVAGFRVLWIRGQPCKWCLFLFTCLYCCYEIKFTVRTLQFPQACFSFFFSPHCFLYWEVIGLGWERREYFELQLAGQRLFLLLWLNLPLWAGGLARCGGQGKWGNEIQQGAAARQACVIPLPCSLMSLCLLEDVTKAGLWDDRRQWWPVFWKSGDKMALPSPMADSSSCTAPLVQLSF